MSNMRIGGLASGMDIDSIVKDLMKAERTRVDKVSQDKILSEWTRDAYNDINKKFADFVLNTREAFGLSDTTKSVSSLTWIKGATIGDTSIADVKARANAVNGSYDIHVEKLATNWSAASKDSISVGDKGNLADQFGIDTTDTIADKINFTIITKNDLNEEQKIKVVINNDEAYIEITDKKGKTEKSPLTDKNISNMSLKEVVKQINSADIGVTAIYDESIDRFFLQTDETGVENTIQIVDDTTGGFINKLKLEHNVDGNMTSVETVTTPEANEIDETTEEKKGVYKGTDAEIDFGAAKGIKQSSNQFTINNIDFDIKAKGLTTVKVGTDENAIVDKVKEFINQYNDLIDAIDSTMGEKRYRDYRPLTAEQKEAMSDKEVEMWEEKAKSGLLRNDQLLSRTLQNLRSGLYESVQGVMGSFSHLTDIGIETESYSSGSMGGKLKINEEDLRTALRDDVDGVMELLFNKPGSDIEGDKEKRENTGLINRMYGDMVTGMKEVIAKAGPGEESHLYRKINTTMLLDFVTQHSSISMLDEGIMNYDKRILQLERRLADKEDSYWQRFTAMEQALSNMYSQSDWLAQQLG